MSTYKKNLELLTKNNVYSKEMEHDACGVGLIASTEGKKSRAVSYTHLTLPTINWV